MRATMAVLLCAALLLCGGCGSGAAAPKSEPAPEPTAVPTAAPTAAPTAEPEQESGGFAPDFTFSTDDRDGNAWDESVFADHELTMINFWEPWCGPCVGEMDELQRLYETYADRGFLILGVYSTPGMEQQVDDVLSSTGVKYPILHYAADFDRFQSGYVPTTVFVDREGRLVTKALAGEALLIGSRSYEDWEALVLAGLS